MSKLSDMIPFSLEWYRELTDNELDSIVTMELTCDYKDWVRHQDHRAFQDHEKSRKNMLAVVTERWKNRSAE